MIFCWAFLGFLLSNLSILILKCAKNVCWKGYWNSFVRPSRAASQPGDLCLESCCCGFWSITSSAESSFNYGSEWSQAKTQLGLLSPLGKTWCHLLLTHSSYLDSCCLEIDVHNGGNRCSPTQPENKIIKERRLRERISSSTVSKHFFSKNTKKVTSIVKVCFLTGLQIGCLTKTLHVLLTWKIIFSLKEYWLQYLSGQVKALNLLAVTEGLVMIVIQTTRRGRGGGE